MLNTFLRIEKMSPYFRNALVLGETGVGKELAARALHDRSPARAGHFVVVNCSAVVETLFESELFGHVRGSFTGADRDKMGLFEHAHGGTLFLDEIGDMPVSTQAKLLRTLQTQEVQRVGSLTGRKVDVRVVAATNKDLRQQVRSRLFRQDLYYRLSMVEIELPPLRERDGDLPLLVEHFMRRWNERFQKSLHGLDAAATDLLERHTWPGNVRELENALGHGCMMAEGVVVTAGDLPGYLAVPRKEPGRIPPGLSAAVNAGTMDLLDAFELRLILQALDDEHWNQSGAARLLCMTRDRLRYKMKKYGLSAGAPPKSVAVA